MYPVIFIIILEIFQYALATDQVSEVSGFNERIESWMATWNTQKVRVYSVLLCYVRVYGVIVWFALVWCAIVWCAIA